MLYHSPGHEGQERYKYLRLWDICLLLNNSAGSTLHICVIREFIHKEDVVHAAVVSFRHKRFGGAIKMFPVRIQRLVLLCPTKQVKNPEEGIESDNLENLAADTKDDEKDLENSDDSWDDVEDPELNVAEDQDDAEATPGHYDAEVALNLADKVLEPADNEEASVEVAATKKAARKPTDNPEAENVLILGTMVFSNFGNPRYQGGDNQSEAWTRWTARMYTGVHEVQGVQDAVDVVDDYKCRLCNQTSTSTYKLWDHLQEAHLDWLLESFTEEASPTTSDGPDSEEAITEDDFADVYARESRATSDNKSLENEVEPANLKRLATETSRAIEALEEEAVTNKVVKRVINIEDDTEEVSGENVFADVYARGSAVGSAEGLEADLEEQPRARLSSLPLPDPRCSAEQATQGRGISQVLASTWPSRDPAFARTNIQPSQGPISSLRKIKTPPRTSEGLRTSFRALLAFSPRRHRKLGLLFS